MSKELVTAITCTGHRPECFKMCFEYMERQTYKGKIQWIVVNDAMTKADVDKAKEAYPQMELYAGPIKWVEGLNTQRANMALALEKVKGDKILFFEDDDYYKPDFIKAMVNLLSYAEIVGESNTKYYHTGLPGWKENHNYGHSSLCQTGIRASQLPLLKEALNSGNKYFDIELWKLAIKNHIPMVLISGLDLCVGIKGLPGRSGIGAGHKVKDYYIDIKGQKLKEWLGEDASNYSQFIKEPVYERIERDNKGRVLREREVRGESPPSRFSSDIRQTNSIKGDNAESIEPS